MKILKGLEIKELDQHTVSKQGIEYIELINRAGTHAAERILQLYPEYDCFWVLCGMGNNGSDGLITGKLLKEAGKTVEFFQIHHKEKPGIQFEQILRNFPFEVRKVNSITELPKPDPEAVIIDALLGIGLDREPDGLILETIDFINSLGRNKVISLDIPSGMYSDIPSNPVQIVIADHTLTFEMPKIAMLMPENLAYTGRWEILEIGLDQEFKDEIKTDYHYLQAKDIHFNKRKPASHKGNYGKGLLIGGSYGKSGAMVLAMKGMLRSGTGLCFSMVPKCSSQIMQLSCPEAMLLDNSGEYYLKPEKSDFGNYDGIGIGPGLGMEASSQDLLKSIIQNAGRPLVIDADAINILAENKTWLHFLPKRSVLTPHHKEFERLAGKFDNSFQRLELQKEFSRKFGVYILFKGPYSALSTPGGEVFFNSTGNPGMAKGGSGDLLTGIITGLMASLKDPFQAAVTGMFVHGLAGDYASNEMGEASLLPGDISYFLGKAFKDLTY